MNSSYKKIVSIVLVAACPTAFALGQSQSQSSPSSQQSSSPTQAQPQQKEESAGEAAKKAQKDKPKPKKVYTEEDLSSMRGNGVSVVGDETPAGTAAEPRRADGKAKTNVAPMSGQDEGYWRGKAHALLDEIAATDQQIARTKDEIKKYGSDGFDATSGLKNNVIYIDNRSSKLQQLEKRKADLEGKLDQLQEEGRKAGAEPSWFR
jgi:hypothetical protein